MAYAWMSEEGNLVTANTLIAVPEGTKYVEFERGSLPDSADILKISNRGNIIVDKVKKAAKKEEEARGVRDEKLKSLVHEFPDGQFIQIRPQDEINIRNAIERMKRRKLATMKWRMADNSWRDITLEELEEALQAGQDNGYLIWAEYASKTKG